MKFHARTLLIVELFKSLVPADDPHVTARPMFGNISAFVNGNMFFGLFGNDLFVRLSDRDRSELLKNKGASNLEPMKGRPMKECIVMRSKWKDDPKTVEPWVARALAWTRRLPPKKKPQK